MNRNHLEVAGVRNTGWAALNRDPQEDIIEFACPRCGQSGAKSARRARTLYHFIDGFLQDPQGELTTCRSCKQALHLTPVVLLHDQDEKRRFEAVFAENLVAVAS